MVLNQVFKRVSGLMSREFNLHIGKFFKIFLSGFILLLNACVPHPSSSSQSHLAGPGPKEIYQQGMLALKQGHFDKANSYFDTLDDDYSLSAYTEKAQLVSIYTHYKTKNYAKALIKAQRYKQVYPRSSHVDYAYYMEGLIQLEIGKLWWQKWLSKDMSGRDLANIKQAQNDFSQLITLFPHSPYYEKAKYYFNAIYNILAYHELKTGIFYLKRQHFVAASHRFQYLIDHYPRSTFVKKAYEYLHIIQDQKNHLKKNNNK